MCIRPLTDFTTNISVFEFLFFNFQVYLEFGQEAAWIIAGDLKFVYFAYRCCRTFLLVLTTYVCQI
jgi:hypothetical protein